ncbi:MAG: site-2 protease family protein [Haloarculaceae archaeon]
MSDPSVPPEAPDDEDAEDRGRDTPPEAPPAEALASVFRVAETRFDGDRVVYFGEPLVGPELLERELWPLFREAGYEVSYRTVSESETDPISGVEIGQTRRPALVATPRSVGIEGIPWTNLATLALTVLTTLYAGSLWYYEPIEGPLDLVTGSNWQFSAAVLFVLGIHELGHYALSRRHDVAASLPYFIPLPNLIGTLGAVIRMKGRIPDREALFDIGVAGPLAGLAATILVTVVGLYLPPIEVPQAVIDSPNAIEISFGYPPLLLALRDLTGQPLTYGPGRAVNPVVFAGWVGMFVTFLNLIPVGQLDGGHVLRAMFGERVETISSLVPAVLFGLAGYLYFVRGLGFRDSVLLWGMWGVLSLAFSYAGSARPVYDDEPLDRTRTAVGVLTLVLGALCFTPVPFEFVAGP